jgi:sugar lactone lactonase YvrE
MGVPSVKRLASVPLLAAMAFVSCQDSSSGGCDPNAEGSICDGFPAVPTPYAVIVGVPTSEDFALDSSGYLINVDCSTGALWRTPHGGEPELLVPSIDPFARGTVILPDGTIALASSANELLLVHTDLTVEVLLSNLPQPNGIAVGMDGMLYVAHLGGELWRVDPGTGVSEVLYTDSTRQFDGITFGPDYTVLYFNTEIGGEIYRMPLDSDDEPGPTELFASIPGNSLLDGMTADSCGNLYVADMNSGVWLVDPQGEATHLVGVNEDGSELNSPNSVSFGSGVGGWNRDQLYVMTFGSDLYQLDVCIVGKDEPHI